MELRFGSYRLRVRERQLIGPGGPLDIDGRALDVLRALLARPNELVLKDEIFAAVWPGLVVGENTLQVHVSSLRKALGPELIETVHGRGYKYRGPEPEVYAANPAARSANGERPVIAVAPFNHTDEDPALASFCAALAGEMIEQLSRFSLLSVISHPVSGAGQSETGADFVLYGEVRGQPSRIRVAAKLQERRSRAVIWAEHHDHSLEDIFAVLDELSGTLAGRINTRIESHMVTRQVSGRALTSYDHLIKGIWHFRSRTPDGPEIAEQLFRKARELNPASAEAVRWLSMKSTCQWLCEHRRSLLLDGLALGRAAAELDPASATCHAALGFAQLWAEGVEMAATSFRKAFAANPNDGYMLADVGLARIYAGRLADGYAMLDRAERLNPFPNDWHSHYRSIGRFMEGEYAAAVPGLHRLPLGVHGLVYLLGCHGHLGNQAAIDSLMPRVAALDCDLVSAAHDEPFLDRAIATRLAEGVQKAMSLGQRA